MSGQRGPGDMTTEPITPERLAAIRERDARYPQGRITNEMGSPIMAAQDRRALLAEVTRLRAALADRDAKIADAREWTVIGHPGWPGVAPTWRDRSRAERFLRDYPHRLAYVVERLRTEWSRALGEESGP